MIRPLWRRRKANTCCYRRTKRRRWTAATVAFDIWRPTGRPRPATAVIRPTTNRFQTATARDCSRLGGGRRRGEGDGDVVIAVVADDGDDDGRRPRKRRRRTTTASCRQRTTRWLWLLAAAEKRLRRTHTSGIGLAAATRTWLTGEAGAADLGTMTPQPLQPRRPLPRNVTATVGNGCRTL